MKARGREAKGDVQRSADESSCCMEAAGGFTCARGSGDGTGAVEHSKVGRVRTPDQMVGHSLEPADKKRRLMGCADTCATDTGITDTNTTETNIAETNTAHHETTDEDLAATTSAKDQLREESTCPICLDIIGKVVESTCGHLFCLKCISAQRMHQNSRGSGDDMTLQCPVCRSRSSWRIDDNLPQGWHFSRFLQRKIDSIPVTCPHAGCGTVTLKGEMADHAAGCAHAPPRPTIPRLTLPLPANGKELSTAVVPADLTAGDMVELELEGLQGIHWQCIVPSGLKAGQLFNVRLAGLSERIARRAVDTTGGNTRVDDNAGTQATVPTTPRLPRPPESDLWRTAWSQRYTRWYWWNTDTLATTWHKPQGVTESTQRAVSH